MRTLLLSLLLLPLLSYAQINRSAKEFASEKISEYVTVKLFKGQTYHPGTYGELKSIGGKRSGINWEMAHVFEIANVSWDESKNVSSRRRYKFLFYLDDKMKVIRAETSYSE